MASGNLTPRQKMINMMYLVLTALLALNVSKEILDAFVKVDSSLKTSTEKVEQQNAMSYAQFEEAVKENPAKSKEWRDKALKVQAAANALYSYIAELKETIIEMSGGYQEVEEEGDIKKPAKMDNREIPANYLLVKEKKAYELNQKIAEFRNVMIENSAGDKQLIANINKIFDTSKQKVGGVPNVDWEKAQFEHYPLMAIVTFLTKMQTDVRTTENDVLTYLQGNIGKYDVKVNKLEATAIVPSTYVFVGDTFKAEIFIAAFDTTKQPEVTVYESYDANGNPVGQGIKVPVKNGRGVYKVPARSEGNFSWGGKVVVSTPQGPVPYDVPEQMYQVAKTAAVISPTKMNVIYRGVDNPIDVSVPGISPDKLEVSCVGCTISGSKGSYIAKAGNGDEAVIKVTANTGNGKKSIGEMKFRVKRIPPPTAMIAGKTEGKISKSALAGTQGVGAFLQDFPFEISYRVVSFTVRAQKGEYTETVTIKGNNFDNQVRGLINNMKPGSDISFTNIIAEGPDGVKNCGAIVFTVQ